MSEPPARLARDGKTTGLYGARGVVAEVLVRVWKEGAFASAAMDAKLESLPTLDPRDRGLITELTYGTLRASRYLEQRLAAFAPKGLGKLDPITRAHLLVAAYQLCFSDKIPPFAAVSEAVSALRHVRGERVAAFGNAVLRQLARQLADEGRPHLKDVLVTTSPRWLRSSLDGALGDGGATLFLRETDPPPVGLRVRKGEREDWFTRIAPVARVVELGRVAPQSLLVWGGKNPRNLPGVQTGELAIQEEGSQLLALAVGARPGDRVLDACAGRGNKTAALLDHVGPDGCVDACDLHPHKIETLRQEMEKLGLQPRETLAVDWTYGSTALPKEYDRILVDAPCSGIGTWRRRPEILRNRTPAGILELQSLQRTILAATAEHLRPGGTLTYAVCSPLREEAEDVIDHVLATHPELRASVFEEPLARDLAKGAATLRLLPYEHGTDGYFLAQLTKVAPP